MPPGKPQRPLLAKRGTAFVFDTHQLRKTIVQKIKKLGKFFEFGPTYRGGRHGLELDNKEAVLLPGQLVLGPPLGQHGFPSFRETPRLRPNKKAYDRPPRDLAGC